MRYKITNNDNVSCVFPGVFVMLKPPGGGPEEGGLVHVSQLSSEYVDSVPDLVQAPRWKFSESLIVIIIIIMMMIMKMMIIMIRILFASSPQAHPRKCTAR